MTLPDHLRFEPLDRVIHPLNARQFADRGWASDSRTALLDADSSFSPSTSLVLLHRQWNIRVVVIGVRIKECRANPSVLLFDNHRGSIRDQAELDLAMAKVWQCLDTISTRNGPVDRVRLRYLEIGWNFALDFSSIQNLLTSSRHEWVRNPVAVQAGKSTRFHGSEFSLKIYNKSMLLERLGESLPTGPQLKSYRQPITRLEAVYIGKKLTWALDHVGVTPDTFPKYDQLQALLRLAVDHVRAPGVPVTRGKHHHLARVVALMHAANVQIFGRPPFDIVAEGMSPASQRRLRKAVESVKVEVGQFDIRTLLGPEGTWPPVISIAA